MSGTSIIAKFSMPLTLLIRDLNQNKTVVPLFALNASPNIVTTILCQFSSTNVSIIPV